MSAIDAVNRAMVVVIGSIIVLLCFLIFYDVFARYFFASPTRFGYDLSIWLTATVAFLGGGYALLSGEHIRVDIFYATFSEKRKIFINFITYGSILLFALALFWFGGLRVLAYWEKGFIPVTGLKLPLWIQWSIVPVSGVLLGLQCLVSFARDVYVLFTGNKLEGHQ